MNQPLQKPDQPELPAELPNSTVSEIASWLVGQPLDAVEREMIRHTLESCGGNRALAASVLGISLPALRKKIRAYSVRGEALPESFEQPKDIPQAENDGAPEVQETEAVIEDVAEVAPTLAVPDPDNDPRLTLVEAEAVSEPAVVQAEPKIVVAPATAPEIIPAAAIAEPAPEPVAAKSAEAVIETPKLIAGIATPRTKQKTSLAGPVLAGALVLLLAAPIAYGFFSTQEKSTAIDADRNRLEITAIEAPRFEQRIQAPVWATPPARTENVMPVDIAADRRAPAVANPAVQPEPAPVVAVAAPEPVAAAEPAPAPEQTVADFNPELGSEMELGPVNIAADIAMDLGPVNRLADVRMELAPADIAADTRMDAGPVNILADVRMEFIAPEITGSIPLPTFFVAPQRVPSPVVREDPDAPVRRAAAPRPARAAPAQEAVPATEPFPLIFPFSLFAPKNAQTGAATTVSSPQPVDCCIR